MPGIGCRFSAVGGTGLGENAAHMVRHGVRADEKRLSDVPIALADGYEAQDLHLALRQTTGIGLRARL